MKPINCIVCWLHVGSPSNPMIVQVPKAEQKFYVRSMWGVSSKSRPAWFLGLFGWSEKPPLALRAVPLVLRAVRETVYGATPYSATLERARQAERASRDKADAKHYGLTVERIQGRRAWMAGKPQLSLEDQDGTWSCDQWMLGWQEMEDVRNQIGHPCEASRDGDCFWHDCPQNRDGESGKSGRHCPLDRENMRGYEDEC